MSTKVSDLELRVLATMGWGFYMTGPNEAEWLKFDDHDKLIAHQGDAMWAKDLAAIKEAL